VPSAILVAINLLRRRRRVHHISCDDNILAPGRLTVQGHFWQRSGENRRGPLLARKVNLRLGRRAPAGTRLGTDNPRLWRSSALETLPAGSVGIAGVDTLVGKVSLWCVLPVCATPTIAVQVYIFIRTNKQEQTSQGVRVLTSGY
jgi:hypothetical protein